jgi:hypothetical protein
MALIWDVLPNQIPTHFNFMGEPDSWSDKQSMLNFSLGLNIGLYLLLLFLPKIDPKKDNFKIFAKEFYIIRLSLQVFFSAILILSLVKAQYVDFDISRYIINMILGLLTLTRKPNFAFVSL